MVTPTAMLRKIGLDDICRCVVLVENKLWHIRVKLVALVISAAAVDKSVIWGGVTNCAFRY